MARKIQPRNKIPKPKKGQSSEDYWRERESRQRAENIRNEAKTAERINRIFQGMQDGIQQEIEAFYQRYASKEGITLTEARGRVSRIDMEQYERLAKKYVEAAHHGDEDLAFSQEANDQMRLYNATMRINRLEMLKARCGIRAMEGYRDTERLINENLEERAYSEYRRLAGILGNSVQFNENMVRAIVNASYQNATWSQRLWNHQASLSSQIGTQLASGILAGKSSTVLAREIQKLTGGSTYACQRLMRTELRRVQTEAALQSMTDNGVAEYKYLVANGVNPCDECLALDGEVFKLSDMNVGKNAPPMHPQCHCATAPYIDEAKWQRWLDGPAQAGVPWKEFEGNAIGSSDNTYNKYNSGPIMDGLNAPGITNSDKTVEQFLKNIEVPKDQGVIDVIKKSVRHMPKEDLNMIMSKGLIVKKTSGMNAFVRSRRFRGEDGSLKYVIKINPNTREPFVFAHECAHFAEKVNGLYKDPQFVKVLKNFGKSISSIEAGEVDKKWYCVGISPLLIEPYQGRTYIKHLGRFGPEKPLHLEHFVEYISDGYECYVGDPKLLESKDPLLYNYFKRRGLR